MMTTKRKTTTAAHWLLITSAFSIFLSTPASAQKNMNIGSIFDAVQGVVQSQQAASMSEQEEVAVGRQIAASTLGTYPPIRDEKLQRYLNTVGEWVALQSDRPKLPWRFAGVESAQVNAFAVPGGIVLITRGMLQLVINEAELACVIGHEIGHIVRRHHLNLLQKELLLQTGARVVSSNVGGGSVGSELGQMAIGEGAQLFGRSLDRGAESEADSDGVLYAARAGYDPAACLGMIQRMSSLKQQSGSLDSLYKTHPQANERAASINAALSNLEGASAGSGALPPLGYKLNGKSNKP